MPRCISQDWCCLCSHSMAGHCQPTLLQETPKHSGNYGSVSCGVTAPFPWVLVFTKFCLCPPRICFPKSYKRSVIKSCWSKSNSLKISSSLAKFPGWVPSQHCKNFHTIIVLQFEKVQDLILSTLCLFYHFFVGSPLSLDVGYLFLVGSGVCLSMVVQ